MLDMLEDWSQWQEEILYGEFVGGRQTWVGMGRAWTSHFGSSRDDERHGLRGPGATELAGAAASLGHVREPSCQGSPRVYCRKASFQDCSFPLGTVCRAPIRLSYFAPCPTSKGCA